MYSILYIHNSAVFPSKMSSISAVQKGLPPPTAADIAFLLNTTEEQTSSPSDHDSIITCEQVIIGPSARPAQLALSPPSLWAVYRFVQEDDSRRRKRGRIRGQDRSAPAGGHCPHEARQGHHACAEGRPHHVPHQGTCPAPTTAAKHGRVLRINC
jgi:hypothetical protein